MKIDLTALQAAADSTNGKFAVVERRWLRDIHAALSGVPFEAVTAPTECEALFAPTIADASFGEAA